MSIDALISVLAALTLFAMMVTIGLTVRRADLSAALRNRGLVARALVANYVAVPAITVVLVTWLGAAPAVAAGFFVLAVCPGAPFTPAMVAFARGDVAAATGLMAALAASSAVLAPLLLRALLPMAGMDGSQVDATAVAGTLMVTQLAPLAATIVVHERRPDLAARVRPFVAGASQALGAATAILIVVAHARLFAEIRFAGLCAMVVLLALSLAAGWWAGGRDRGLRKAVALTTSLRNAGAALAIAGSAFAGTAAGNAVIAYFFVEVFGSLVVSWWWRAAGSA